MSNFVDGLEQLLNVMTIKRNNTQEQLIELEQHIHILGNAIAEMHSTGLIKPTETDNPYPTKMYIE